MQPRCRGGAGGGGRGEISAAQQADKDVRYISAASPLHLRYISATSPMYLTAAQQVDEDVRELRAAQARLDGLD